MDSRRYSVIFEGKVVDGVDPETARSNLQRLLKIDSATVDKLFSGKRRVLKKEASTDIVKKYQAALNKAGVECIVEPVTSPTKPGPALALEPKPVEPEPPPENKTAEGSEAVNPYAPPQKDPVASRQVYCRSCGKQIDATAGTCPGCGAHQLVGKPKSKVPAALLAIFLGFLGIHRFYLGQWVGIVYLIFGFLVWPIAWIEAIVFLCTSRERWDQKYGNVVGGGAAMMIVVAVLFVAVIGILAAIAIPQYNEYTQRVKILQSITAVQPSLDKVAEIGRQQKYFPNSNAEAGLAEDLSFKSLSSFRISDDGVVTLSFDAQISHLLDGETLLYIPKLDGNTVTWDCSGGTLANQLRPPQCRDGKYTGQQAAVTRQWVIADDNATRLRAPASWKKHSELTEDGSIELARPSKDQYLVVISESKADFSRDTDVFVFNDMVHQNFHESISNLQVKYLGEVTINGMHGLKHELRGEIENHKVVYLQVALESEHRFHQILIWTVPTGWSANLKQFEEIVNSFTECPAGCDGS